MRLLICLAPLIGCAAPAAAEAPAKLYTPLPAPMSYAPIDPPLEALRGRLREIVARKDLAALRAHVIAKGFFWENDWDFMFEAGKTPGSAPAGTTFSAPQPRRSRPGTPAAPA